MHNKVKIRRNTEMDFKELSLQDLRHEHPLTLIDLQLMHRDYVEDDDDYNEKELIAMQNFECTCDRCGRRIDWYHRYYYKCSMSHSSCNYSIHKFCEEIPTTLKFQGHPSHPLILKETTNDQKCNSCLRSHRDGICYDCSSCNYEIDLLCATFVEQNTIHYPGHPHPLISVSFESGLNKCFACEKKHEGRFYHCTTCFNFSINFDCLSLLLKYHIALYLPIKFLLDTRQFSHRHLLTLSYSFKDRLYDFECRICGNKFEDEHLIYKCTKCMYYVHSDCATQRIEPFMAIMLPGKTQKNFKDVDHPNLIHLPLIDESHSILSHILYQGKSSCDDEQLDIDENGHLLIHHENHKHPLVLINNITPSSSSSSSSMMIKLHDPMKRTKVLCNGCSRPITKIPFYKCSKHDEDDFALHDWCATRLPKELKNHVGHPQHTLHLNNYDTKIRRFQCSFCRSYYNGFSYRCFSCNYNIDVNCAFIPEEITHEAHADHLLTRVDHASSSPRLAGNIECRACRVTIDKKVDIYFRCGACDFYLDCRCALHLPKTIRHKLDKHPLELSYGPIEDHKSEYFCEVCEEGLDPGKWFYHCVECAQSIHSACAPLILQSEQGVNSGYELEGVYKFINIKFGAVEKLITWHHHPVLFAPGTKNDGLCKDCDRKLQSNMIWKCLHCNYASHYFTCIYLYPSGSVLQIRNIFEAKERTIIKHRPKTNIEFYPSEIIRPVTHHWKVVQP
ncbi:hypothetical protein SSX86_014409 [Deinandra increscens subsp. villosa]|uniref:DC1 domain-containing protein n=1 Tax=Deinandra increscens subsp. villosa TaxID=3103831 RepID=A0AAP0D6G7_9ASTR